MTSTSTRAAALVALATVALALVLLLPGLGTAPFDDPGEGQHAEIAREAWRSGDWVTLRLNGVRYFDKPPLLYLMQAAAFSVGGVSEWTARLGPVAGAALAAAATALLGARLLGAGAGLIAGTALLSCALFAAFARYVRPETLFLAAIQWGFTGLLLGWRENRRGWSVAGCVALGLASLAKDPLGLVGPLLAVAAALALAGRVRPVAAWLPPAGAALLLLVGGGWYALAAARNPGFLWYVFVDNHARNAALARLFPDEDLPISSLEFAAATAMGAFPWIVPAALLTLALVRRRAWREAAEVPWVALAIWAVGSIAIFLVLPFRLPHHGLPAYPAVALLAARWWWERRAAEARVAGWLHVALLGLVALACALGAASDGRLFTDGILGVSDVTTRKATTADSGITLDALWPQFAVLLGGAAGVFAVGAVALAGMLALLAGRGGGNARARLTRAPAMLVALTMLATVPLVGAGLGILANSRAVPELAAEVAAWARPDDLLVHEGPIEVSGALELYSGRRPVLLDGTRSVLAFGATFPDARESFWTGERFRREWLSDGTVFLVTPRAPERSAIGTVPPERRRLVVEHNGRRLYVNAPQPSR
jgi:4-amino-4-deoxy-L-arabinose transferase-like glycosyltransferase